MPCSNGIDASSVACAERSTKWRTLDPMTRIRARRDRVASPYSSGARGAADILEESDRVRPWLST